jgi:hypothetical protein
MDKSVSYHVEVPGFIKENHIRAWRMEMLMIQIIPVSRIFINIMYLLSRLGAAAALFF